MPNPLLFRRQPVVSKTDVDRRGVEPIMEEYAGTNRPYLGTQDHGVPAPYVDHGGERSTVPRGEVEFEEPKSEEPPIPVRVVQSEGNELRTFRTLRDYVPAAGVPQVQGARRIVGADMTRTKAKVQIFDPASAETVYIGATASDAAAMNGFPLRAGGTFETNAQTEIYALASGAADVPIAVYIEFTTGL